jgi:hypothetical protein
MRNLQVIKVNIKGMDGFQIQGLHRACSDSHWEAITHAAIFRDEKRAERFLEKVRKSSPRRLNGAYWGVPQNHVVNVCDAFQGLVAPFSVI